MVANVKIGDLSALSAVVATTKFETEDAAGTASERATAAQIKAYLDLNFSPADLPSNRIVTASETLKNNDNDTSLPTSAHLRAELNRRAVSVKDFGAVGDNSTDDTAAIQAAIDFCFGTTASPHGNSTSLNFPLYFPPGQYRITSALTFRSVNGGTIFGAGRTVSRIIQATSNLNCITTNGMSYTTFRDMWFEASGASARVFDLNYDGTGGVVLQQVTFENCYFDGNGTALRGLDIGRGGFQGSECVIQNCFFDSCVQGIRTSNLNALQNQVIGGNIASCTYGIYVSQGSIPLVMNTGFQFQTGFDIKVDNSADAHDTMTIIGCRTESENFFIAENNPLPVTIIGVNQTDTSDGIFIQSDAQSRVSIINCGSMTGQIVATNPKIWITGSDFDRSANLFATGFFGTANYVIVDQSSISGTHVRHREMYFDIANNAGFVQHDWNQRVIQAITGAETLTSNQCGICFNNTGATARVDFTLPAAVAGLVFGPFVVTDTDGIRIIAVGNDTIRIAAAVSAAAGRIDSATIGDSVTLTCLSGTEWVATALVGAGWTAT